MDRMRINMKWKESLGKTRRQSQELGTDAIGIFLSWEDDGTSAGTEHHELCSTLRDEFGIRGHPFAIPSDSPDERIKRHVADRLAMSPTSPASPRLVILYYNGQVEDTGQALFLVPFGGNTDTRLKWTSILNMLRESGSDILVLFDGIVSDAAWEKLSNYDDSLKSIQARFHLLASPLDPEPTSSQQLAKRILDVLRIWDEKRIKASQFLDVIIDMLDGRRPLRYRNESREQRRDPMIQLTRSLATVGCVSTTPQYSLRGDGLVGLESMANSAPRQVQIMELLEGSINTGVNPDSDCQPICLALGLRPNTKVSDEVRKWLGTHGFSISKSASGEKQKGQQAETPDDPQIVKFVSELNKIKDLRAIMPTTAGLYKRVVVLPIVWYDTKGFTPEEENKDLLLGLRQLFGFDVQETMKLQKSGAEGALKRKLKKIIEGLDDGDMFMAIYNGHGSDTFGSQIDAPMTSLWMSGFNPSEKLCWTNLQPLLYDAACDTVQILDCCYAGHAKKGPSQGSMSMSFEMALSSARYKKGASQIPKAIGKNEILAACDREHQADAGAHAYVHQLAHAMQSLHKSGELVTLEKLHNRVDSVRNELNKTWTLTTKDRDRMPVPVHRMESGTGSITLRNIQVEAKREGFGGSVSGGAGSKKYVYAMHEVDEEGRILEAKFFTEMEMKKALGNDGSTGEPRAAS